MKKWILLFLTMALLGITCSVYVSYNCLTVNTYEYNTEKTDSKLRLVILSDLHDHEFGENNERLVSRVKEQSPDLILILGDMLDDVSENAEIPCALISRLKHIAPVYYALGNHEAAYIEQRGKMSAENVTVLQDELEEAGATVLDKDYVDIEVNGENLRLGGLLDYAFALNGEDEASKTPENVKIYLEDFQNTDALKIMMAHRPDSFVFGDACEYWDIDLILCGHNHGGQVVLPFLGGVFGGDQGYFPEYVHGMYEKGDVHLFVTSGLSSNRKLLPRFNNPPEIAVIEIK